MHLLFKVPLLGPALFGLRSASGYDRQGNVRVAMTAEESEHRYKHEQRTVSKRGRAQVGLRGVGCPRGQAALGGRPPTLWLA